ncbi:MAG: alpha/beta hydrolase-fold protein [Fimbriimonadaceae bacterium]|nr:alpha/beta hydrolase-fold protein [Fimbriimonadaceae bacterium]
MIYRTFESASAKQLVSYHLYRPKAYDESDTTRFPVVYWLHGSGGGLAGIPALVRHFQSAIDDKKVAPFLVVFVNGMPNGMYVDWKDGSVPMERVIVDDLVTHIDATYRTLANREGRMLDGFSMGGYGAARFGLKYPDKFRAVSILGAGPMQADLRDAPRAGRQRANAILERVYGGDPAHFLAVSPRTLATKRATEIRAKSLIRIVIGDRDETLPANRDFHEHLETLKIPHEWIVLPRVRHETMAVLSALGDRNWEFYRKSFGP